MQTREAGVSQGVAASVPVETADEYRHARRVLRALAVKRVGIFILDDESVELVEVDQWRRHFINEEFEFFLQ